MNRRSFIQLTSAATIGAAFARVPASVLPWQPVGVSFQGVNLPPNPNRAAELHLLRARVQKSLRPARNSRVHDGNCSWDAA